MTLDLSYRRILVTGAAQGLGLGIARFLAQCRARVVLTDVDPRVRDHLGEAPFTESAAVIEDLADPSAAERIIEKAVSHLGALDGLVNCAAWSLPRLLADTTVEDFDRLVAINQRAPFLLTQKFIARLTGRDRDPGVVNIASINAEIGNPRLSAYAGTKGALVSMTRALAVELAPTVRVVAISPGAIRTDFTEQLIRQGLIDPEALSKKRLIPQFTEVNEIAALVGFLMSPSAKCVTGSNWIIDGGYTAQ